MFGQAVAFLVVVASVAFANACGHCYKGYGGLSSPVISVLPSGVSNGCIRRVLRTGCNTEVISSAVPVFPIVPAQRYEAVFASRDCNAPVVSTSYAGAVGRPEVYSSCENSIPAPVVVTPVVSSGVCGIREIGSGCDSRIVTTVC